MTTGKENGPQSVSCWTHQCEDVEGRRWSTCHALLHAPRRPELKSRPSFPKCGHRGGQLGGRQRRKDAMNPKRHGWLSRCPSDGATSAGLIIIVQNRCFLPTGRWVEGLGRGGGGGEGEREGIPRWWWVWEGGQWGLTPSGPTPAAVMSNWATRPASSLPKIPPAQDRWRRFLATRTGLR